MTKYNNSTEWKKPEKFNVPPTVANTTSQEFL